MSSYGNHVWTAERDAAARNLVERDMNCDDDGFAEQLHRIAGITPLGWPFGPDAAPTKWDYRMVGELLAVTALLAEKLASQLLESQPEDTLGLVDYTVGPDWQARVDASTAQR